MVHVVDLLNASCELVTCLAFENVGAPKIRTCVVNMYMFIYMCSDIPIGWGS